MRWLWIPLALAALSFVADRLLLWMELRGWIDYRRTDLGRIHSGQIGPALLGIQSLFQPGARHHLQEQNAVRTERQATGDGEGEEEDRGGR